MLEFMILVLILNSGIMFAEPESCWLDTEPDHYSSRLRDRTKKAEPLTRAARRAQRVQDRPRRRRRSGRSCATERSEGAPILAQRPGGRSASLRLQALRGAAASTGPAR